MAVFLHAAGFHCLTFDVRGHGDEPGRGRCPSAPASSAPTRWPPSGAARAARGDGRGDRRPLDGRHRGDPGGRRRPAGRGRGRDLRPGRSVPADPPDVPPRPAADPRLHRLPARLAHDAGLPATARPQRARDQRDRRDRALRGSGPARPRRRGRRRAAGHMERLARRAARAARRRRRRRSVRRSRPSSSRAASTRGCTRTRAIGARSPRSWPRRSVGRCDPATAGDIAGGTPAERIPDRRSVDSRPSSRRRAACGRWPRSRCPGRDPAAAPRIVTSRRSPATRRPASRERRVTDPVWAAIASSGPSGGSPTGRWSPLTWSASCAPAGTPAAPRTGSAGRSSSAAIGRTCGSSPQSVRMPGTWPGRPSGSRSSRPTRAPTGAACRSCSTWGWPPRT